MNDDGDGTDGGDASDSAVPEDVLRLDAVYDALANPRRRLVCYLLSEREQWSLTDLAVRVAAWEEGVAASAVDETTRDRVSAALYHAHVPKLADLHVVSFDEGARTVSAGPEADRVLAALEAIGSRLVDEADGEVEEADGAGDEADDDADGEGEGETDATGDEG